jgi:DNA repair protein RadA/Sms
MPKVKTTFACQNCGYSSPKWMGKCPACQEWNTIVEEVIDSGKERPYEWDKAVGKGGKTKKRPKTLDEIEDKDVSRIETNDNEFNRVLGGGIVPGSLILLGGEPGIGKSTLMLQIGLSSPSIKILYISGEESEYQIKMRAQRLGVQHPEYYMLTETNTQNIFAQASNLNPDILIIDSIQTLHSQLLDATPGSVSQIRECAGELQRYAKETDTPVLLIGHITKDGSIAGPKLLEHMVDTVLQFEGERNHQYRILRTMKNRFGSTAELGIYEMTGKGLREVDNPSEILISDREHPVSGIAIAAMVEGVRPMLIEVQALVANSVYGTAQRFSTGFNLRRLHMLLAVLEKRCGFNISNKDVFLNIAGGIRVEDPAIDLAIICALISSIMDISIIKNTAFAGEVGLSGEIRAVTRVEQRIMEADKLGFEQIYISNQNLKGLDLKKFNLEIKAVNSVVEILNELFNS